MLTRFEAQKYAREAFDLGVRYIGGCCGFEPHHIRAMSEELKAERGKDAPITQQYGDILSGFRTSSSENWRNRCLLIRNPPVLSVSRACTKHSRYS